MLYVNFQELFKMTFFHTRWRTKHYIMCHSTSRGALPSCMLIILSHTKKKISTGSTQLLL